MAVREALTRLFTGRRPEDRRGTLEELVAQAASLRDHMIRAGGAEVGPLVSALRPFEKAGRDAPPGDEEIAALYAAFQQVHDTARARIDPYTLNEVLKGRSPFFRRASLLGSLALTVLGVVLVLLAFHFSYWSNRTSYELSEAERFSEFDHFAQIMRLVELENYFDASDLGAESPDLEPHLLYLEGMSALSRHYSDEVEIPPRMASLTFDVNPMKSIGQRSCRGLRRTLPTLAAVACAPELRSETSGKSEIGGTIGSLDGVAGEEAGEGAALAIGRGAEAALEARQTAFQATIANIQRLRDETMEAAGRDPEAVEDYATSRQQVLAYAEELKSMLSIVHRWALPIIYGALGSVVYCMWRILSPSLASLGLLYTVLRTAFAGLAALTLSMLLIPSNALATGAEASRPLIYLLSFIFGYSIEAFVNTLNGLNQFVATSLRPRDPGGARQDGAVPRADHGGGR